MGISLSTQFVLRSSLAILSFLVLRLRFLFSISLGAFPKVASHSLLLFQNNASAYASSGFPRSGSDQATRSIDASQRREGPVGALLSHKKAPDQYGQGLLS
jgi:hypothetical protein